jgi:hypothetical protein
MPVAQILEQSWNDLTVFPESIPHLLHWDLAYLWILRRPSQLRPDSWAWRAQAWERLLIHFLTGVLETEEQEIPEPLLSYARRFGVTRVTTLAKTIAGQRVVVGVLSPVCLVRPLPDATQSILEQLPEDPVPRDISSYFLHLLQDQLSILCERTQGEAAGQGLVSRPLQNELKRILDVLVSRYPTEGRSFHGTSRSIRLLKDVSFTRREAGAADDYDELTASLYDRSAPIERTYVPRCESCHRLLTREDRPEDAVKVTGEYAEILCNCGRNNPVPLERFFIWKRPIPSAQPEYVCWTDRQGRFIEPQDPKAVEWAPQAQVSDGSVCFEWNSAILGGEAVRRKLRFVFPEGRCRSASVFEDALYKSLVVPGGEVQRFTGLPVKFEWRDVWTGGAREALTESVSYRQVQLHGLPFTFTQRYLGHSLAPDMSLAVGIYPKPMHAEWKPYRAVILKGEDRPSLSLRLENSLGGLSFCQDSSGWPRWLSVETDDKRQGATWDLKQVHEQEVHRERTAQHRIRIGVDFGTTNTVVYFQDQDDASLTTASNGLRLQDYHDLVYWLHSRPRESDAGWFLPALPGEQQDPYLIPSAVWLLDGRTCALRWGPAPPACRGSEHGFKWDDGLQDRSHIRKRFIRDLFFFSLPAILQRLGNRCASVAADVSFAYPLAFSYQQRMSFQQLVRQFKTEFQKECGFLLTTFSINESEGAVKAAGAPLPGSLFLVADMGGRTLDLALFAYRTGPPQDVDEKFFQIGSVDFGGEAFLGAVTKARTQEAEGERYREEYWRLRNSIQRGTGARELQGDVTVEQTLERMQVMALEFLRVMLKALIEHPPANGSEVRPDSIRLLLVGNGWKLRHLVAGPNDPRRFAHEYFTQRVRSFGLPQVEVVEPAIPGIDDSKHWVACGALKAAARQRDELAQTPYGSKLPSGRRLQCGDQTIQWHELLGTGGVYLEDETAVRNGHIDCDIAGMPACEGAWARLLDEHIPATRRYPAPDAMREYLLRSLEQQRLAKGPLQLILETHWKAMLCREDQ